MQIPTYEELCFLEKKKDYLLGIPVLNEGEKFKKQIKRIFSHKIHDVVDIVIFDGDSRDGSTDPSFLKEHGVSAILIKKGKGALGAQLRMGFSYALSKGYKGVITVDGNGKDNVEVIPAFVKKMEEGFDFVQGSRFIKGGRAINTPLIRYCAVRGIHAPLISILSRKLYTDTTNGFRGYSSKLLSDSRLQLFRDVFDTYQLLFYISVQAARQGFKIAEIPVTRAYPKKGKVPTKIKWTGCIKMLHELLELSLGKYDPSNKV